MARLLTVRRLAALGVAAAGLEAVLDATAPDDPGRRRLVAHFTPGGLPPLAHVLAGVVGVALLALAPKLWRGTRTATSVAIGVLVALAALNLIKGLDYEEAALELGLAALLAVERGAFPLGSRNRPRPSLVCAAVVMWGLTYCAVHLGPTAPGHAVLGRVLHHATRQALVPAHLASAWISVTEILIAVAATISVLAIRSLLRPQAGGDGHRELEYWLARSIIERHGEDSLSPFALRPDKALHFAAGGVLTYRLAGETAIVSGDPVGPPGTTRAVLESFLEFARGQGWGVSVWAASSRQLAAYRELGLHAVQVGEEAFVDPARFTLEGRRVRKLRQSVHRLERRGWQITACEGVDLDERLESEIAQLNAVWRASQKRLLGFAMGMGPFDPDVRPRDLFLLARSPRGELRGSMRFAQHRGKLSLDTMRRIGDTPNGLNEALVCRALQLARDRAIAEVSLNYAGLAHLARAAQSAGGVSQRCCGMILLPLGRHFRLERLVRFNEKFLPEWRPRFLVYESRTGLPLTTLRVLQVEGYLPQLRRPRFRHGLGHRRPPLPRSTQPDAAG